VDVVLDNERGVNPGMELCFFCNEPKGVVLWGKLKGETRRVLQESGIKDRVDGEAPSKVVLDREPCGACKGLMKKGIILISVREPKDREEEKNPYRTGGWCVVTEEAIRRWIEPGGLLASILESRVSFLPDDAWDLIGLPRLEDE